MAATVNTTTPTPQVTTPVSTTTASPSLDAIIAQLKSLIAIIKSLGGSVSPELEATINALSGTPAASSTFARDLQIGSTGDDVQALQQYLNAHGAMLAASGPGSPGNETMKFGSVTKAALIKFQKAAGISPAAGYFGPKTRAYVASHP